VLGVLQTETAMSSIVNLLYTLRPTPYTLHPTPNTPHPTPYTLHPAPYTRNLEPLTRALVRDISGGSGVETFNHESLAIVQHGRLQEVLYRPCVARRNFRHELEGVVDLIEGRAQLDASLRQREVEEGAAVEVEDVEGEDAHGAGDLVERHVLARTLC